MASVYHCNTAGHISSAARLYDKSEYFRFEHKGHHLLAFGNFKADSVPVLPQRQFRSLLLWRRPASLDRLREWSDIKNIAFPADEKFVFNNHMNQLRELPDHNKEVVNGYVRPTPRSN